MSLSDLFSIIREKIVKKKLVLRSIFQSKIKAVTAKLIFKIQNRHDKKLIKRWCTPEALSLTRLKYLGLVLSRKEKITITVLVCCIFGATTVLLFNVYLANTIIVGISGGNFTEGIVGYPQNINPLFANLNRADQSISSLIFSSLFKYDDNLKLIPDLVDNYKLSNDNKTYVIHLKKNIKWHDGKPFTSQDVVFTIEYTQNQSINLPLYLTLKNVNVKLVDDFTVELNISEPLAVFIEHLTFGILPAHILKDINVNNLSRSEFNQKPVGLGPFKFKNLVTDKKSGTIQSYTLTRNEEYYDKKPYLQTISFKFYLDNEEAFSELKNNNIDGLILSPHLDIVQDIKHNNRLLSYNLTIPKYTAVFYNSLNSKILADKTVRKSLAMAIDRKKIIDQVLNGHGLLVDGPIILQDYLSSVTKDVTYNPKLAENLLIKSGWYKDGLVFKKKNSDKSVNSLNIVLTTVEHEENLRVATLIKKDWEQLGVAVDLKPVPVSEIYQNIITPRTYESFLYAEQLGSDPNPYPFWHSSQRKSPGLNLSLFSNSNVDKLLEENRTERNILARQEKYIKFQELVKEEQPAIFLYVPVYQYLVTKNIYNLKINKGIDLSGRFINISEWYTKTKRVRK